jgi:hypothetical protein
MKLKIIGGTLEVEMAEGMGIDDIRIMLKKLATADAEETVNNVKTAGVSPHSSKSNMQDKLNAKPKMPI